MKVYIGCIQTKTPKYKINQKDSLQWLIKAHSYNANDEEKKLYEKKILRVSCLEDKIAFRYSELSDVTHQNWDAMQLLSPVSASSEKSIAERMIFYKNVTQQVFDALYSTHVTNPPKHLIHVSCTGYMSPSVAQTFVSEKNWCLHTTVTHCYHMGCYAAFPAIRIAKGFVLSDCTNQESVDIVHTELCTLHFNVHAKTLDQHVIQSLFADGYAKYTLSMNSKYFKAHYFELLAMYEKIIPNTENAMTWTVGQFAFEMTISASVPNIILENIREFLKTLLARSKETINLKECLFAIHPGGPKIISSVQQALDLTSDQIQDSVQILKNHGNMSSVTIPHIWQSILAKKSHVNSHVISIAFGPGLTVSGSIMKICANELD